LSKTHSKNSKKPAPNLNFICSKQDNTQKDWHSGDCKLTLTLTFDLLTSNKMGDQELSRTIYLPNLVMIRAVVVALKR